MTNVQGADASPSGLRVPGVLRILVADDVVDAAESVGMLLELRGHDVRVVHTGREAIEVAASYRPDVILLDISLPDMSGYDVARALQAAPGDSSPVVVAVTGFGGEDDRERAREAGIDLHLTKPVDPARLLELVNGLGESRGVRGPQH